LLTNSGDGGVRILLPMLPLQVQRATAAVVMAAVVMAAAAMAAAEPLR